MHFSTAIIVSFLSATAFTAAYHIDNPFSSLHLRDLEVRDLYPISLHERAVNEDLSIRDLDNELLVRDLYAEGFLHARSLYGRGLGPSKATDASAQVEARLAHLRSLRSDLADANSALKTMLKNTLQEANPLDINRLKTKIMNLQGEIMKANGGALR
ncbi:hypothetical protein MMC11_004772 [Xylographa trunciseda]|nr:hypothetical protein [Xylographa trunciseda]